MVYPRMVFRVIRIGTIQDPGLRDTNELRSARPKTKDHHNITPAIKYLNIVIPAYAGIQVGTGCRIKSGMTGLVYLVARLIRQHTSSILRSDCCISHRMGTS